MNSMALTKRDRHCNSFHRDSQCQLDIAHSIVVFIVFVCLASLMDIDFIAVTGKIRNCRMQFEIRPLSAITHIDHMRSIHSGNVMPTKALKKTRQLIRFIELYFKSIVFQAKIWRVSDITPYKRINQAYHQNDTSLVSHHQYQHISIYETQSNRYISNQKGHSESIESYKNGDGSNILLLYVSFIWVMFAKMNDQ